MLSEDRNVWVTVLLSILAGFALFFVQGIANADRFD